MICFTIFTAFHEWYTFVPKEEAISMVQDWRTGVDGWVDITGKDEDGRSQRAIFKLSEVIGVSVSDATRWKRPSPPAQFMP